MNQSSHRVASDPNGACFFPPFGTERTVDFLVGSSPEPNAGQVFPDRYTI
ncbi:MAG: hypothetical protein ACTSVZ_12000 [Promethearchaeota archaeon]